MIQIKRVKEFETKAGVIEYRICNDNKKDYIYFFYEKDMDLIKEIIKDKNLMILNLHNKDRDIRNFCNDILSFNDLVIRIED
jgi:hypothetical protein